MEPALWSLSDELDKCKLTPPSSRNCKSLALKKPLELRFTSHTMSDQLLEAGSELELKCEVTSLPTAIVMWYVYDPQLVLMAKSQAIQW